MLSPTTDFAFFTSTTLCAQSTYAQSDPSLLLSSFYSWDQTHALPLNTSQDVAGTFNTFIRFLFNHNIISPAAAACSIPAPSRKYIVRLQFGRRKTSLLAALLDTAELHQSAEPLRRCRRDPQWECWCIRGNRRDQCRDVEHRLE